MVFNDNRSLVTHVRSTNRHQNPRLTSVWSLLRDLYSSHRLVIRWISRETQNVADVLTKERSPLLGLLLQYLRKGKIDIWPGNQDSKLKLTGAKNGY